MPHTTHLGAKVILRTSNRGDTFRSSEPADYGLRRASFCTRPVQKRKSSSSHFDAQKNPKMSLARKLSAGFPEYVSTLHFRNSLRHGVRRCPRVAFQINFSAPNKLFPPNEHSSAGA